MENINITPIVEAIIALMGTLITVFLIPYIKRKVGAENMAEFLRWVDIAVAAAEQLYDSTQGDVKKQYVLAFLESKGIDFDVDEIDTAIEAAVNKLHNELYGAPVLEATKDVTTNA